MVKENGLIIILCKTNSIPIIDLVEGYVKDFYGHDNVTRKVVALYGDLDIMSNKLIEELLNNKKNICIVRDEGFRPYDDMYYKPMCKKLMKKGCKFAYIFDTAVNEILYSGSTLKEKVVEMIYETKKIIDSQF